MLKSLQNYLDRVYQNSLNMTDLISTYKLDEAQPLVPQIEAHLGRPLTETEKVKLMAAPNLSEVSFYQEKDEEERLTFRRTVRIQRNIRKKKKK
jgi:hypothetical protein